MEIKLKSTTNLNLWIYFKVYGSHDAAIEICDRANAGDELALEFANKIWRKEY